MDRSQLFGLALKSSGLTAAGFVQKYLDEPVSESAVWAVAAGRKTSARISKAIDRLVADERPNVLRVFQAPLSQAA